MMATFPVVAALQLCERCLDREFVKVKYECILIDCRKVHILCIPCMKWILAR